MKLRVLSLSLFAVLFIGCSKKGETNYKYPYEIGKSFEPPYYSIENYEKNKSNSIGSNHFRIDKEDYLIWGEIPVSSSTVFYDVDSNNNYIISAVEYNLLSNSHTILPKLKKFYLLESQSVKDNKKIFTFSEPNSENLVQLIDFDTLLICSSEKSDLKDQDYIYSQITGADGFLLLMSKQDALKNAKNLGYEVVRESSEDFDQWTGVHTFYLINKKQYLDPDYHKNIKNKFIESSYNVLVKKIKEIEEHSLYLYTGVDENIIELSFVNVNGKDLLCNYNFNIENVELKSYSDFLMSICRKYELSSVSMTSYGKHYNFDSSNKNHLELFFNDDKSEYKNVLQITYSVIDDKIEEYKNQTKSKIQDKIKEEEKQANSKEGLVNRL